MMASAAMAPRVFRPKARVARPRASMSCPIDVAMVSALSGRAQYSVSPLARCRQPALCSLIVTARMFARRGGWLRFTVVAIVPMSAAACDPVINIQGSFFPAWIACMSVGIVLTAVCRQLFAVTRLEPHLGPLLLIYPSLWLLVTLLIWLAFYRT